MCWSGAGPTLLGISRGAEATRCRRRRRRPWTRSTFPGQVLVLHPDMHGLIVDRGDRPDVYDFNDELTAPRPGTGAGVSAAVVSWRADEPPRVDCGSPWGSRGPATFHIRTFGCQMNEHDSERLAGALVADGLEATDDLEPADVVVFNTCCIRENADNKFYGHLGNLKALRERRPGMQIAVGGCLAQKDRERVRQRAAHVDVVFGTHNLTRAPALLRQAATTGPVVEILDEDPRPESGPDEAGNRPQPWPPCVTYPTPPG